MKQIRMKKRFMTLFAMVMAFTLCMTTMLPAFAANVPPSGNRTTTLKKYLVMDAEANVPNVKFNFTITSGSQVNATSDSPAIYAGIGTPTISSATFSSSDSTIQGTPENTTALDKKYATQTVTVDFENVSFTAPGIYRYIVTETSNTDNGITNDTVTTRTLDVYVSYKNDSETELEVAYYVLHEGLENPNTATKSTGFTNTYSTQNLTLEKQVTGNQGDRDKYFEFTVNITNAVAGTVYTVDLSNAEENPTVGNQQKTNPSTLTATGGTVTATYYLKDDQSIVIQGLTGNTGYTITETSYADDGYTTSYVIDTGAENKTSTTGNQTMDNSDHKVTFTNNKSGTIPTGVLLEVAPYALLGVVVLSGLVVLFVTRKRPTNR